MSLKVCLAGATGWAGSELARGIAAASDLELIAGVSRNHAGKLLGEVLNDSRLTTRLYASAAEALVEPCHVFVEYTKPASAKANILLALQHGAHVVVGTSGLIEADFAEIDTVARERQRGVLACGNFALTAVLLQKFAESAAKYLSHWEIVDYGSATKADVPSGTVRELAARLSRVREPQVTIAPAKAIGPPESRGATVAGTQVRAPARPCARRRCHLRDARSNAHVAPSGRKQRSAVRRRGAARDSKGVRPRGGSPRPGSGTRALALGFRVQCAALLRAHAIKARPRRLRLSQTVAPLPAERTARDVISGSRVRPSPAPAAVGPTTACGIPGQTRQTRGHCKNEHTSQRSRSRFSRICRVGPSVAVQHSPGFLQCVREERHCGEPGASRLAGARRGVRDRGHSEAPS